MDDMFRYVAVRNPRRIASTGTLVSVDVAPDQRSDFLRDLITLTAGGATDAVIANRAAEHQRTAEFARLLIGPFATIDAVEAAAGRQPVGAAGALAAAVRAFGLAGNDPAREMLALLNGNDGRGTERRLVEGILSLNYAPSTVHVPDDLIRGLKIIRLLRAAAEGNWPFDTDRLFPELLERLTPILPTAFWVMAVALPATRDPPRMVLPPPSRPRTAVLSDALDELTQPRLLRQVTARPSVLPVDVQTFRAGRPLFSFFGPAVSGRGPSLTVSSVPPANLTAEAYDGLTGETRAVLTELGFGRDSTELVLAQRVVEDELALAHSQSLPPRRYTVTLGNMRISVSGARPGFAPPGRTVLDPVSLLPLLSPHYGGQGELRVVRQELIAYELGDIAHVENVLQGEHKRRRHRTLDRTEELERELLDETTESERDLQSTDRHELEVEAQRTATQEGHVEGGVQVSGSYGPSITFSTNASAGFSFHTEQSERRAARFAQEVVERTVERIKSRTLRERRVVRVREVEELNSHGINNAVAGSSHVRGVYRWLNKIYRAQIFSYGMRHMFEFMVPEPAAFYLWSVAQPWASPTALPALDKPAFGPEGITRTGWHLKAAEYAAQGVQPPPPTAIYVAYTTNGSGPGNHVVTEKVKIPDGYEAFQAVCTVNFTTQNGVPEDGGWWLAVHDHAESHNASPFCDLIGFSIVTSGEVPISYRDWGLLTYAVTVNIGCSITWPHFRKWQLDTYTAIVDAYTAYENELQARQAQAEIGRGISIPGRNPLENRKIIANELQRSCLSLLTESDLDGLTGFMATPPDEARNWRMDNAAARRLGTDVRFFQQAFEWENMTYVFYPYFWGRSGDRWVETLHHAGDPDPLFADFIKAGMARVQVPVRPGFEAAVARYSQDKKTWNGSDAPLIGDSLYVPIIDEIKRELGAPDGGRPIGDPWEVRVPTALVLLEDAANLRGFRDPLFGDAAGRSSIAFVARS